MLEFIVSKCATLLTLGLFSTGISTVQKIKRKGTGDIPILPFVSMATTTFLWLNYGTMKGDGTLIFINFVGFLLNCGYVLLYYWYTPNKSSVYRTVGMFMVSLLVIHLYSSWQHTNPAEAIEFIGIVADIVTVATFASPLTQLKVVFEKKSTESMSFPLALMTLAAGVAWWWYGVIVSDVYIQLPNACGAVLGLVQVALFGVYWKAEPVKLVNIMDHV